MARASSAVLTLLVACSRRAPEGVIPPDAPIAGARFANAHLLAGEGGRGLLGHFVSAGEWPLDGSAARETACSRAIRPDREPAAAELDGVYSGTPEIGRKLGIVGDAPVVLWLDHDPSPGLVAGVDPEELRTCCEADPSACDEAYVGEIVSGRARVYRPDGDPPVWFKAGAAQGDLGFRLAGNPFVGPDCGLWRQHPPRAATGAWLLGVSNATFTEANARADALQRVKQQGAARLRAAGASESVLSNLRQDRWCVESFPGAGGTQYVAYLLAWLPD